MKVSLSTHGGLAGLTGAGGPSHVVDSDGLGDDATAELNRLVAAATSNQSKGPKRSDDRRPPDAMSYEIRIEDAGESEVLRATDGSVPKEFAELRNFIRRR